MLGRFEIGGIVPVAISTLRTILESTGPSGLRMDIVEAFIGVEDVELSTQESLEWVRKSAAGTGTAAALKALTEGDAAFGGSARYNMSAEGTIIDTFPARSFNVVGNGYLFQPVPKGIITVAEGGIIGIRFRQAPEAAVITTASFIVELH